MPRNEIDFDAVRKIASALPDIEESGTDRGLALKVGGRMLACPAIHKSAEPNSLMVRISFDDRARLLAAEPDAYYLTDHYSNYPAILVRLSKISRNSLHDLLGTAWLFVRAKTTKGGTQSAKQKSSPARTKRPSRRSTKR